MRKIAVIGAGPAGLLCAIGLRHHCYDVTVFSDRTADSWFHDAVPTGLNGIQKASVDIERSYGLDFWGTEPQVEGIDITLVHDGSTPGPRLIGRAAGNMQAVDLRLKCSRWINEFKQRGGNLVIQSVGMEELEAITEKHDLTVVAAGKAQLIGQIFERDAKRSLYSEPQRNLCMLIVDGVKPELFPGMRFSSLKFNMYPEIGEYFWLPFFHKTQRRCHAVLFEAKAGGPMDRFGNCRSGAEAVKIAKEFLREHARWEYEASRNMRVMDEKSWLVGRFAPTVRNSVGRLPSGAIATAVGDAAIVFDPVGGQGANNGIRMAHNLIEQVVARGSLDYDESWMTATFERHWERFGKYSYAFNNLLLEPLEAPATEVLMAAAQNNLIADDFVERFNDPIRFFPWIQDMDKAREYLSGFPTNKRP